MPRYARRHARFADAIIFDAITLAFRRYYAMIFFAIILPRYFSPAPFSLRRCHYFIASRHAAMPCR
jgi:hypothetical protein